MNIKKQIKSEEQLKQYNIFNDTNLLNIIKEKFDDSDNMLFEMSYKLYQLSNNTTEKYVIDLDEIYTWVGFMNKRDAKTLITNKFMENIDYKCVCINMNDSTRKKHNYDKIFLSVSCFKKFCMLANTKISDKIYDYYINFEEIILKYLQEQYINTSIQLLHQTQQLEESRYIIGKQHKVISRMQTTHT